MTPPLDTSRADDPLAYDRALAAHRDEPLLWYHPDDAELLQYGKEDWDGPHQGKHGGTYWISRTGKHRRVYSTENPGIKGDAHRKRIEEGQQKRAEAKAAGKQHATAQKEWERHFKAREAEEKAARPVRSAASAHQLIGAMMARVKAGETVSAAEATAFSQELLGHLQELSVKDIQALKEQHGLKASGVKAQLALKVAAAALRPPRPARAGPSRAAAQGPAPWEGGPVEPGKVYNAPTGSLAVDPTRFQFKLNTNEAGVTDELKDVKTFNPDFAGVVSVWKDPANGKTYVVNGHHRKELADRTGHPDLAVRYVEAKDAREARALGALVNIAEGRGTAIDAAKFMRDMNVDPAGLEKYGVSLKGKLAQDATALVNLNDRQFDRLARGLLVPEKALAVAKHLKNPELQDQLFRLLEQREDAGKDLTPKVIEEMAIKMANTPTTSTTEKTLFGDITSEESLFVPIAEVQAHVRSALGREVNDFLAVANAKRAGRVAGAGNVLNIEENRRIATEAARVQHIYEKLVNRKGPIADAINEAGAAYAAAKTKKERDDAKRAAVEQVRDAIFAEANIGQLGEGAVGPAAGTAGAGNPPGEPGGTAAVVPGGASGSEAQPGAPGTGGAGENAPDAGRGGEQPAGVSEAVAKQPHEMTRDEYRAMAASHLTPRDKLRGKRADAKQAIAEKKLTELSKEWDSLSSQRASASSDSERRNLGRRLDAISSSMEQQRLHAKQAAEDRGAVSSFDLLHRAGVEMALRKGQPVPPEVLADYPDLQTKQSPPPTGEQPTEKGRKLFHVTKKGLGPTIRKEGFKPGTREGLELGPGVYLAKDAERFPTHLKRNDTGEVQETETVETRLRPGVKLFQIDSDRPNAVAEIYRGIYGYEEGNRRYDQEAKNLFTRRGLPNWPHLHELLKKAGYGGIERTSREGDVGNTDMVVFDPKDVEATSAPAVDPEKSAAQPAPASAAISEKKQESSQKGLTNPPGGGTIPAETEKPRPGGRTMTASKIAGVPDGLVSELSRIAHLQTINPHNTDAAAGAASAEAAQWIRGNSRHWRELLKSKAFPKPAAAAPATAVANKPTTVAKPDHGHVARAIGDFLGNPQEEEQVVDLGGQGALLAAIEQMHRQRAGATRGDYRKKLWTAANAAVSAATVPTADEFAALPDNLKALWADAAQRRSFSRIKRTAELTWGEQGYQDRLARAVKDAAAPILAEAGAHA